MPVYLFYGEEDYLLKRSLKALRDQVVDPAMAGLSHKILEQPRIHEVNEAIGAVSFALGGNTLYEVRQFAYLSKASASSADDTQLEELKALLESLEPTKSVLFINDKINKSVKFPKWLVKLPGITVAEFKPFAFWETDKAIQQLIHEARLEGVTLTPKAALLLVEHLGVSLQPLVNEVRKLSVFSGGKPVEESHVLALSNHNENTFSMLSDWLHQRHSAAVFTTLDELLLKQHPVQLFALIQTYLNNFFQLKLWQRLGQGEAKIAERSGKHPFKIKKDLQEIAPVSFERLESLKGKALDMEWKAKTGQLDGRLALEILLAS
ncbi:MAG: DNA polymerase III subunit delta [Vampirovibrionales bacterium]|nr:DNA polymerase III subunit delta [Vampirovibrionales bacterium]